ncbi:MAG: hypothetical protein AAF432_03970 [Planctomycetota bacterium]
MSRRSDSARRRKARRRSRRAVALVLSICVLVVFSGLLPSSSYVVKALQRLAGERFPCEGCACACESAETCWTTCRCATVDAKLAWARANGVEVPKAFVKFYVEAPAPEATASCCPPAPKKRVDDCCAPGDEDERDLTVIVSNCRAVDFLLSVGVIPGLTGAVSTWTIEPFRNEFAPVRDQRCPAVDTMAPDPPPPRMHCA